MSSGFFDDFVRGFLMPGKIGIFLVTGAAIGVATGCIAIIINNQADSKNREEFEKRIYNFRMMEIINRLEEIKRSLDSYTKTLHHLETSEILGSGCQVCQKFHKRQIEGKISRETQTNLVFFNQSSENLQRRAFQVNGENSATVGGKFCETVDPKSLRTDSFVPTLKTERSGSNETPSSKSGIASRFSSKGILIDGFSKTPEINSFSSIESQMMRKCGEPSKTASNSAIVSDPSGSPAAYSTLLENPVKIALDLSPNKDKIFSRDSTIYFSNVSEEPPDSYRKKSQGILKQIRKILRYKFKYKKVGKKRQRDEFTSNDSALMSTYESSSAQIPKIRITQH